MDAVTGRRAWALRLLVLLVLVTLVAPTAVLGGRASRGTDHSVSLYCFGALTSSAGSVDLYVSTSERWGPDAWLAFWEVGVEPFEGPITLMRDWDSPVSVSFDGSALAATIPLVDTNGDPAGQAFVAATMERDGDPWTFDDRFRDGNRQHRASGTVQPLRITAGTLTLPGSIVFSLVDTCAGEDLTISFFDTNPAAYTNRFTFNSIGCALEDGAGHTAFLFADTSDLANVYVNVFVPVSDFDFQEGSGIVDLSSGSAAAVLDVYDSTIGDLTGVQATLSINVAATGVRGDYSLRGATGRVRVSADVFDVSGSITFPAAGALAQRVTFSLDACVLTDGTSKVVFRPARVPRPTGKAPSNDLPAGAKLVAPGTNLAEQTKNAAYDMEAPYACLSFTEPDGTLFAVPVIKTLWYKVTGTGGTITVDTAGSAFDTVAAAYTANGAGGYAPVAGACVDDVPLDPIGRTLQSKISWPSVAGVTYYVQIGGFPDDLNWGSLHVSVR